MDECCKYEPIIVNGEYVGGNIIYCLRHAAAPELYEALKSLNDKTDANDWNYYECYHADNLIARIKGEGIPFPEIYGKGNSSDC